MSGKLLSNSIFVKNQAKQLDRIKKCKNILTMRLFRFIIHVLILSLLLLLWQKKRSKSTGSLL